MELQNNEKNIVELAQKYITLFLKDKVSEEEMIQIQNMFQTLPVEFVDMQSVTSELGHTEKSGGFYNRTDMKITVSNSSSHISKYTSEYELLSKLDPIIHEYTHAIRALKNNNYDRLLEEGFVVIFTEACINYSKNLASGKTDENSFKYESRVSNKYSNYVSQIKGLLYLTRDKGLDVNMITDYITCNKDIFIAKYQAIFGEKLKEYLEVASSRDNSNSEEVLVNLITDYIKQHGISLSEYYQNSSIYSTGSNSLAKSIISLGIDCLNPEDREYYKSLEYACKISETDKNLRDDETVKRIQGVINNKYTLANKSATEIENTICDLCSDYIQHEGSDDKEWKVFISQLKADFPNIQDFVEKYRKLRIARQDSKILDGLDLSNLTYDDILNNMNNLLNQENVR